MDFQQDSYVSCTRKLEWDSLHRIPNHSGKCRSFHGHHYEGTVECTGDFPNDSGMVVDFFVIKRELQTWIDEHWDHTAILADDDTHPASLALRKANSELGKPVYLLSAVPSAENIALELAAVARNRLQQYGLRVTKVTVFETPRCSATWHAARI